MRYHCFPLTILHWHYAVKMARKTASFTHTAGQKCRFLALEEIHPQISARFVMTE